MSRTPVSLRSKLYSSFFGLVALTLLVSGFGLTQLWQLNRAVDDIATMQLPSVTALAGIRATANQIRRAEAEHVLNTEDAAVKAIDEKIVQLRGQMDQQVEDYKKLLDTEAERKIFAEFQRTRDEYYKTLEVVLPLSRAGEAQFPAARTAHISTSKPAFEAWVATVGQLVQLNNDGARASALQAASAYATGSRASWILAVVSVLVGAGLAAFIIRSVMSQIGGDPAVAVALAQRVADGDLATEITLHESDTASLLAVLRKMQVSLRDVVSSVLQNAEAVATASAQIAQGNSDLSSRTEEQASALEETASSMEQLGSTVRQNADNARQASQLANSASTTAREGGDAVGTVMQTMSEIDESSRKIADIVGVIEGISFQTNILALNASVEAARAGEHGRGFAVVAEEVRTLAQRSATAAREIKSLIATSSERVSRGTAEVTQAGQKMDQIVSSIQRVTDIMAEISAASQEQSQGVAQVGEAVTQMDKTTQQNAALVEESAAAAESLRTQSSNLVGLVSSFKIS